MQLSYAEDPGTQSVDRVRRSNDIELNRQVDPRSMPTSKAKPALAGKRYHGALICWTANGMWSACWKSTLRHLHCPGLRWV